MGALKMDQVIKSMVVDNLTDPDKPSSAIIECGNGFRITVQEAGLVISHADNFYIVEAGQLSNGRTVLEVGHGE